MSNGIYFTNLTSNVIIYEKSTKCLSGVSTEGGEEHGGSDEADILVEKVLNERRDAPVVPLPVHQKHPPKKSKTGECKIRAANSLASLFAHYTYIRQQINHEKINIHSRQNEEPMAFH